jgi:glycosyltransferase involved in cell wall biosynthesis
VALFLPNLEIGGAENLVLNLLSEFLRAEGFVFHLVLLGAGGKLAPAARGLLAKENFRFHELGLPVRYGWRPARRLNSYLQGQKIRIVHSHLYDCDKTCFILKLMNPRVKVISTKHATFLHRFPTAAINFLSQFLFSKIVFIDANQRALYARNSFVFANNVLIPNGIPMPAERPRADTESLREDAESLREDRSGKTRIVYAGSLRREKGPDVLVAALNLLAGEGLPFRCEVIGDGPELGALRAAVDPRLDVEFQPARSGIAAELGRFDLAVIPSRREGFGLLMLESFLARVPVIASDCAALADKAGKGERATLFRSEDARDLADKIRDFIRAPSEQSRKLEAARKYAMEFSIERTASSYLNLYRRAAGRSVVSEAKRAAMPLAGVGT